MKIVKFVRQQTGIDFAVRFFPPKKDGTGAFAHLAKKQINFFLSNRCTNEEFVSILMHEVSHFVAYRQRKFKIYHRCSAFRNKAEIRAFIRTGWRAELYVDRQASLLQKSLFGSKYKKKRRGYTKADKKWFDDYMFADLRECL
jgi:hypothetical protein